MYRPTGVNDAFTIPTTVAEAQNLCVSEIMSC